MKTKWLQRNKTTKTENDNREMQNNQKRVTWYKVMQNQEKERESKGTGSVGAMQNNLIEQRDKYMHRKVK